jgi:hypothetical protein
MSKTVSRLFEFLGTTLGSFATIISIFLGETLLVSDGSGLNTQPADP